MYLTFLHARVICKVLIDEASMMKAALEKVFKLYHHYFESDESDSTYTLLNAIDHFNEKLNQKKSINLLSIDQFITLKAIRNYYYQNQQLRSELRLINTQNHSSFYTSATYITLMPAHSVTKSIEIDKTLNKSQQKIVQSCLFWYGNVVNIYPCLYNFMAKFYGFIVAHDWQPETTEFLQFEKWQHYETDNHFSHLIQGEIISHTGHINQVLEELYKNQSVGV